MKKKCHSSSGAIILFNFSCFLALVIMCFVPVQNMIPLSQQKQQGSRPPFPPEASAHHCTARLFG